MGSLITIPGYPSSDKVPGPYGEVVYGAGAISAGDIPLELLLAGVMISGTATADTTIVDVISADVANAAFGIQSQIARMCRAALRIAGVTIKAIGLTAAAGGVAAALTFTIVAGQSAGGSYSFRIGGESYSITIAATDTATTAGVKLRDAINANAGAPCTAAAVVGVVTATMAFVGATGNEYIAFGDSSALPSGCTITLGGGGVATTGGGLHFATGAGTESVTNALAVLLPTKYDRIGIAQNDATNLALWKTQINLQAGVLENRRQHLTCCVTAIQSTAVSRAQTTLNAARFQVLHGFDDETHSSERAAEFAARRTQGSAADPDAAFDDYAFVGGPGNQQRADWPTHATLVTALNAGVTPLYYTKQGAFICRSICTHSLNGTAPDYRTLDTSDAEVPDYMLTDLMLQWSTVFKPANRRVRDNPAPTEPDPPDGVAYPDLWTRFVTTRLRRFERGDGLPTGIIINVSANLPVSSWDSNAKRIQGAVNVVPAPNQHSIGISCRQFAA